jgi:hypothetical protein
MIYIRNNFINKNERDYILNELSIYYNALNDSDIPGTANVQSALGYNPNSRDASLWSDNNPIRAFNSSSSHNAALNLLYDVYRRVKAELEQTYQKQFRLVNCILNKMVAGASNGMHTDDQPGYDEPVHTCLIYLSSYNEDFQGGEIYFLKEDLLIEPQKNMLIFFEGHTERPHEVKKILSGVRETITMQFTVEE